MAKAERCQIIYFKISMEQHVEGEGTWLETGVMFPILSVTVDLKITGGRCSATHEGMGMGMAREG